MGSTCYSHHKKQFCDSKNLHYLKTTKIINHE